MLNSNKEVCRNTLVKKIRKNFKFSEKGDIIKYNKKMEGSV